ncbi:MAG: XRE family transcriptional regulator [Kineosporiaceae bacterium]
MKQDTEEDVDALVRRRLRGLRVARGWSLDELAARCYLSASTLSRIETGHRRIALDQLVGLARALGTTLDQLVEPTDDTDVVIRPVHDTVGGVTVWLLNRDPGPGGTRVMKMRLEKSVEERLADPHDLRVHPGRDWFTVLEGTVELRLGERTVLVRTGEAAEFSTMTPHAVGAHGGPAEILCIFDQEGHRSHAVTGP